MQDTFFSTREAVLRTHPSPVQIRTMLGEEPPVYVVCPGRTYQRVRSDALMFSRSRSRDRQGLTLGHLKGHARGDGTVRLDPGCVSGRATSGLRSRASRWTSAVRLRRERRYKVYKGAGWIRWAAPGWWTLPSSRLRPRGVHGIRLRIRAPTAWRWSVWHPRPRLFFEGDLALLRGLEFLVSRRSRVRFPGLPRLRRLRPFHRVG